jgi:hypothetical protein
MTPVSRSYRSKSADLAEFTTPSGANTLVVDRIVVSYAMPRSTASRPGPMTWRAGKPALRQVAAVGTADDVGAPRHGGSNKVHVVGVELSADNAQLFGQVCKEVRAGLPGQVVDDLADGPVMKAGLFRQRTANRRGGDALGVEKRAEHIQELLDDGELVLHAAKTLERVAHELHADHFGRKAVDDDAVGCKFQEPKVRAGRPA